MSVPSNSYVKLPGTGHQLGSYTRLYRGVDHLLQISSVTFSENYKRFYFRDIQAFIVVPTIGWIIWTAIWGVPAATCIAIEVLAPGYAGIVFAIPFFVALVINLLRGPTCRCYVRTAVQTEKLPSLNRLRRVDKILADLKPLLDAAQGPMPVITTDAGGETSSEPLPQN